MLFIGILANTGFTEVSASPRQRGEAGELLRHCFDLYDRGNWNDALASLHTFFNLYDDPDDAENSYDCARAYLLAGNIHLGFADYATAAKYYEKSLSLCDRYGMSETGMKLCGNLAVTYCFLDNRAMAEHYLERTMNFKGIDPAFLLCNKYIIKGYIERRFGDWQAAVTEMKRALALAVQDTSLTFKRTTPLSEITEMYEQHEMPDSALHYLRLYEKSAKEYNIANMITDCERLYMRIYTKIGDREKALYHQDRYFLLSDSLLDTNSFLNLTGKYQKEREERADNRIKDLQFTLSRLNAILIGIGIILVITIAVTIVIMRQKRRLNMLYVSLYEKNRELLLLSGNGSSTSPVSSTSDTQERDDSGDSSLTIEPAVFDALKKRILSVMENTAEWTSPDFSLQRLADLADSNTRYVSQVINTGFGKNFRSFLNEYRIRESMNRMADITAYGNYTIQAIGESVGFRSVSNFVATFKKHTGLTPSFYQKMSMEQGNHN